MRIRIITFTLNVPADDYIRHATDIAPAFRSWPGLLAKWWLGDAASGTYGGVYLFATRADADRSRDTDLFRDMNTNPAFKDFTVREYDLLDVPTAITAAIPQEAGRGAVMTMSEPMSPARETDRDPAFDATALDWARMSWTALHHFSNGGVYVYFAGLDAETARTAVYGASAQRLEDIRRAYDADGVLNDAAARN